MRIAISLLTTLFFLSPLWAQSETEKLQDFFVKSFQSSLDLHPELQTQIGIKTDYDKLEDMSEKSMLIDHEKNIRELKELSKFEYGKLTDEAKLSYDIFKKIAKRNIDGYRWRFHHYYINQMFGRQSELPAFMISLHTIESSKDASAYISRLNQFKTNFAQLIATMKKAEAAGIIPPKFALEKAIDDIDNLLKGAPFDKSKSASPLLEDFEKKISKLSIQKSRKRALIRQAKKALVDSVGPGYQALKSYLVELAKDAPTEGGALNLPNGKQFYQYMLDYHTTTSTTGPKLHQLGLQEVARIHAEMRAIAKKVGFKKDLKAFFAHIKNSPEFRYPNTKEGKEAYLKKATALIETMKSKLDGLFGIKPKAPIVVKPVEKFREKSAGSAFYQQPSKDGSRPGIYYVNLYDMSAQLKTEMEALAYHEGIPGHHMQLAISLELEDLPDFRKYEWFTAYGEGWGLYSEYLPKEMGFYQDPYSDFGRLSMELWRACRLVVDTGVHYYGWSREKAIKYLADNTPGSDIDNTKSIERYIVMPGQATGYKVGMLKILELRDYAQKKLGKKFDIRKFHDVVLKHGTIPLSVLESLVKDWVNKTANS